MARVEFHSHFALVPILLVLAGPAAARTWVMPHVLETAGTAATTQYSFDTTIYATYSPGLAGLPAGGGATVDLHLFDNAGLPMMQNGNVVCGPCSVALDSNAPKQNFRIDNLINAQSPFVSGSKIGFGVVVVGGADPDGVALQGFVINAHTSAFDITTTPVGPQPLGHLCDDAAPTGDFARAYSFPHVLEHEGRITNTQYTFDTTINAVYTGDLAGNPPGPTGRANLLLYLFETDGDPMLSSTAQVVCAPCAYALNTSTRKVAINLESEFLIHGGIVGSHTGFAIVVVEGDPDYVNLQAFVNNAHTSAFDLSTMVLEPRVLPENAGVDVPAAGPALDGAMRVTPNPARAGAALGFTLAREMDVELAIYDVNGRKVAQVWNGRRAAGPHSLGWDGRLDDGTVAPAGVYFARLAGEGVLLQNRVVALR